MRAPGAEDAAAEKDEDEDIDARPFLVDAIRTMIASGEIIDMKTVAALALINSQ